MGQDPEMMFEAALATVTATLSSVPQRSASISESRSGQEFQNLELRDVRVTSRCRRLSVPRGNLRSGR